MSRKNWSLRYAAIIQYVQWSCTMILFFLIYLFDLLCLSVLYNPRSRPEWAFQRRRRLLNLEFQCLLLLMSSELQVNLCEWGPEMQVYFHLLSFSAVENQSFGSSVMTLQISELSNWIRRANQFNSTRNSYPIFHYNYTLTFIPLLMPWFIPYINFKKKKKSNTSIG